jgi:hypothetical protein
MFGYGLTEMRNMQFIQREIMFYLMQQMQTRRAFRSYSQVVLELSELPQHQLRMYMQLRR